MVTFVTRPVRIGDHVDAVLDSPTACRRVLQAIVDLEHAGELDHPRWSSVRTALWILRGRPGQRR